jgi:hypothetical protein
MPANCCPRSVSAAHDRSPSLLTLRHVPNGADVPQPLTARAARTRNARPKVSSFGPVFPRCSLLIACSPSSPIPKPKSPIPTSVLSPRQSPVRHAPLTSTRVVLSAQDCWRCFGSGLAVGWRCVGRGLAVFWPCFSGTSFRRTSSLTQTSVDALTTRPPKSPIFLPTTANHRHF